MVVSSRAVPTSGIRRPGSSCTPPGSTTPPSSPPTGAPTASDWSRARSTEAPRSGRSVPPSSDRHCRSSRPAAPAGAVTDVAFSADGQRIVTASDAVRIWDVRPVGDGERASLPLPTIWSGQVEFTPSGSRLIIVADDGKAGAGLLAWDLGAPAPTPFGLSLTLAERAVRGEPGRRIGHPAASRWGPRPGRRDERQPTSDRCSVRILGARWRPPRRLAHAGFRRVGRTRRSRGLAEGAAAVDRSPGGRSGRDHRHRRRRRRPGAGRGRARRC